MSRRLFTACLGTETNSFSPIPTGMGLFGDTMLVRGGRHGEQPALFAGPLLAWRRRAQALGWTVSEGLAAFAGPAGNTTRATYEALRTEILNDLAAALPVDTVLLSLHGAMIADGYPDAEGDLLAQVRALVGPDVVVGAELDLHCHLTQLKLDAADLLVIFKEYPHVDVVDRAEELFTLLQRTLDGDARPVMAMHDCRMLAVYPTTREPMRSFVDRMQRLEREAGVLSVSLAHGFPWGDTPECGTRVLVIADGQPALAERLARTLGDEVWAMRDAIVPPFLGIDAALDRVVAAPADARPFVLADVADNPGIGSAGDSTFILRRLIDRGVGGVAISPLWDPGAVALAFDAGVGARLQMRIGGKLGPGSGEPVDVRVTVRALTPRGSQPFAGTQAPLGRLACLRITLPPAPGAAAGPDWIDVVVNDYRIQSFDPACFREGGVDPADCRALIVKSTQHFHAGFAPIAREILYVSAPGSGSMDMQALHFEQLVRPMWPRVADPHR